MLDLNNTPYWYALYTRSRAEKRVDEELRKKGFESYLPLVTTIQQWSDRKKKVELPLFNSYVFVRMALRKRIAALETNGVVRLVSLTGQPSPIPDYEINSLRRLLEQTDNIFPVDYIPVGRMVEVIHGPFAGIRGRLLDHRGDTQLLVGIEQIRQAISLQIEACWVKPVESDAAAEAR